MKITIEVSKYELEEMGFTELDLKEEIIERLDDDLCGFYVEIVKT